MSNTSLNRGYFSISDILASQERIPCTFTKKFPRLGFFDPSSDSEDIEVGTNLPLPLWLAEGILSRKWPNGTVITAEVPKAYGKDHQDVISADAKMVNLHKSGPHYYSFGTYLCELKTIDSMDVSKLLVYAFKNRISHVMDISQNALHEDTTLLMDKLDETERELFRIGKEGALNFGRWLSRKADKITTSSMVENHKKRKRAILEAE